MQFRFIEILLRLKQRHWGKEDVDLPRGGILALRTHHNGYVGRNSVRPLAFLLRGDLCATRGGIGSEAQK
jgi:hypothetical protein